MEQDPPTQPKLIFGLTPASTLANAFVFLTLSSVFWTMSFISQIPQGYTYEDMITKADKIPVSWYIDMPLMLLSIIMILRWVEYKFRISPTEISFRATLIKYFYPITFVFLFTSIIKIILLSILLP